MDPHKSPKAPSDPKTPLPTPTAPKDPKTPKPPPKSSQIPPPKSPIAPIGSRGVSAAPWWRGKETGIGEGSQSFLGVPEFFWGSQGILRRGPRVFGEGSQGFFWGSQSFFGGPSDFGEGSIWKQELY